MKRLVLSVVLLVSLTLFANIVAKVGGEPITDKDLRGRNMEDVIKNKVLEKIAEERGYLDSLEQTPYEEMKEVTLIRRLYKETIQNKVKVNPADVVEFHKMKTKRLRVKKIVVKRLHFANKIWARLKRGMKFDELARRYSIDKHSKRRGGDIGWVVWRWAPDPITKHAFNLKKGQFSKPFWTRQGWTIIYVEDESLMPKNTYEQEKASLEMTIGRIIARDKATKHINTITKILRIKFKKKGLDIIARRGKYIPRNNIPNFEANEMNEPVATTSMGVYTIQDFINSLKISRRKPNYGEEDNVKSFIQWQLIYKLLYSEAVRRNINLEPEIKKRLESLKEGELIQFLVKKDIEPYILPSDSELMDYYKKSIDEYTIPEERKVYEILVTTKDTADFIYAQLRKGKNFSKLAKQYSKHWTKARGGEVGFIPKGRMPDIDKVVFSMPIGRYSKPFSVRNGWAIVKVTDMKKSSTRPFEQVKNRVRMSLRKEKTQEMMNKLYEENKDKIGVEIIKKQEEN